MIKTLITILLAMAMAGWVFVSITRLTNKCYYHLKMSRMCYHNTKCYTILALTGCFDTILQSSSCQLHICPINVFIVILLYMFYRKNYSCSHGKDVQIAQCLNLLTPKHWDVGSNPAHIGVCRTLFICSLCDQQEQLHWKTVLRFNN